MAVLEKGDFCPLIKKSCIGLKCSWFTKVAGYDTNTGKDVESWECAVTWLPMLLIENSGQQRQTGGAIESFRNEVVKSNARATELLFKTSSSVLVEDGSTKPNRLKGK
tara:strand:- start:2353 stop:2676 length:324 start_codon:yes stop_codon:yes gene_type:complete